MKNVGLILLALFSVAVLAEPIAKFQEVVPGQIYRGGTPDANGLKMLRKRYHIRTIINLQGDPTLPMLSERDGSRKREGDLANQLGMNYFNAPTPAVPFMSANDELMREVAAVMADPAYQPVFVHCSLGGDRTGLAIAVYRVLYNGWTADQADQEMIATGHTGIRRFFTHSLDSALYRIAGQGDE